MAAPARPHHRLIWKYTLVVVVLVTAAIVSVGVTEFYFAYEDSRRAVTGVEADKASSAAVSIDQFIEEMLSDLDTVAPSTVDPAQRLQQFRGLQAHQKLLSKLTYFDASGRACVRVYSLDMDVIDEKVCGSEAALTPAFSRARTGQPYFGRVTFSERDSRPHMTIAITEHAPGQGVIEADVDLRSVVDAIARAKIGAAGYAYAVDAQGTLIAHPDKDLSSRTRASQRSHRCGPH